MADGVGDVQGYQVGHCLMAVGYYKEVRELVLRFDSFRVFMSLNRVWERLSK